MIVVDSTVWVDYFNGVECRETDKLNSLLGVELIAVGDVILTEVLQGFRSDADYKAARKLITSLTVLPMLGEDQETIKAADNYRALRRKGFTVRKTIDTIIATYCIEHNLPLLHRDSDFDPFERLGLRSITSRA